MRKRCVAAWCAHTHACGLLYASHAHVPDTALGHLPQDGYTALMFAARASTACVAALLAADGIDVNAATEVRRRPSSRLSFPGLASRVVSATTPYASRHVWPQDGDTALMLAAGSASVERVALLLAMDGINVNAQTVGGGMVVPHAYSALSSSPLWPHLCTPAHIHTQTHKHTNTNTHATAF